MLVGYARVSTTDQNLDCGCKSGKGSGVAAAPSPKNRTGRVTGIRLKPLKRPVKDAV